MLGMLMSVTTKSNLLLRSLFSAATPSSASSASAKPLSLSRLRTMRRMVEKSSTIKKRRAVVTWDPFGRELLWALSWVAGLVTSRNCYLLGGGFSRRSEEHTSELQSQFHLV